MSGAAPPTRPAGIRELGHARAQLGRLCAQLVAMNRDYAGMDATAVFSMGEAAALLMRARERLQCQMIELEMHDPAYNRQTGDKHE